MKTVEKVARALALSAGGKITGPGRHRATDEFGWDMNHNYMGKYVDVHWREHVQSAIFAIEALKQLSGDPLGAMFNAMFEDKFDGSQALVMGAGFDAAIDAILDDWAEE